MASAILVAQKEVTKKHPQPVSHVQLDAQPVLHQQYVLTVKVSIRYMKKSVWMIALWQHMRRMEYAWDALIIA
jgi:hypothetical protein